MPRNDKQSDQAEHLPLNTDAEAVSIWERPNRAERKVRDLFVWKSLSHPERVYPKGAFTTIATIALLFSIICAFFQEWFLIGLSWATVFLLFAMSKVSPVEVEHRITTQGIISMGHTYLWSELGTFWFSDRSDHRLLHVGYRNVFGQLVFLINKNDEDTIRDELAQFLPFIEVWQKSSIEKISDWVSKKFPLEKILASKSTPSQSMAEVPTTKGDQQETEPPSPSLPSELELEKASHPSEESAPPTPSAPDIASS